MQISSLQDSISLSVQEVSPQFSHCSSSPSFQHFDLSLVGDWSVLHWAEHGPQTPHSPHPGQSCIPHSSWRVSHSTFPAASQLKQRCFTCIPSPPHELVQELNAIVSQLNASHIPQASSDSSALQTVPFGYSPSMPSASAVVLQEHTRNPRYSTDQGCPGTGLAWDPDRRKLKIRDPTGTRLSSLGGSRTTLVPIMAQIMDFGV